MTFNNYKEFCENADFYKRNYQNIDRVKNIKLQNEYRKCWKDYVYELEEQMKLKHLIWDYLNDNIGLKGLTIYYFGK